MYKAPFFEDNWNEPTAYPDRISLSYGQDPSVQAAVSWRTSTDIDTAYAEIALATAAPKFWRNARTLPAKLERFDGRGILMAEVEAHYFSVRFDTLLPDTTYAYRVGDGKRWSEWFQFRTASREMDRPFSFLYVGDAQNFILELWSRLIREGYRKAPDARFVVHAGDLVNRAHNDREWQEWFEAGSFIHSSIAAFPVPGNHEYRGRTQEELDRRERYLSAQWRPQFTLPENGPAGLEETVYFMDYQDVRLIALNSNQRQEEQVQWVDSILSASTQKWKIVTFHHPLFSASKGRNNEKLRSLWKPVFDKHGVDLVLQGHDHSYARGRVSPGSNVLDGVNLRDQTGTVYVVSVSGGKMYQLKPDGWDEWGAEQDRAAENTQLFQVITVDGNRLDFASYTAVGELYDAFRLEKQESGPNRFTELSEQAIGLRRFDNTIPYQDVLPEAIKNELLRKNKGYELDRVRYRGEEQLEGYQVELEKDDKTLILTLDKNGKVLNKEVEKE